MCVCVCVCVRACVRACLGRGADGGREYGWTGNGGEGVVRDETKRGRKLEHSAINKCLYALLFRPTLSIL